MTLGTWLDTWFELYIEPSALAQRTKDMYKHCVSLVPAWLATMPLQNVTPLELQRWLVALHRTHARTSQQCRVMLSRSMNTARKLGMIAIIIDQDTLPTPAHKAAKRNVLTEQQLVTYMRAAAQSPCGPLLMLCCIGLRRGEALGAQWADIKDGYIHVHQQRLRTSTGYQLARLKSDHSERWLALPDCLLQLLDRTPRTISGFIVDTTPERLHAEHTAIIDGHALPHVTIHGLRHTFATCAATHNVSMKLLQVAMGHSNTRLTTDLYADHLQATSLLTKLEYITIT